MRSTKTVNGEKTRYVYDNGNIIGEIFGDTINEYARGTEIIGMWNNKGDRYYYEQNSHGDVLAIADEFGEIKKSYTYDAYGKEQLFSITPQGENTLALVWKAETERIYNPFRYCGEYADSETGMIYLRNRYYDPSVGRFITEDPAKDGLNWYVYCSGNPVMHVDPTGLYLTDEDKKYGEGTKIYTSLAILDEAERAFPEYYSAISELENEMRWIGNEWGSDKIEQRVSGLLKLKQAQSLSTVEQVLAAAYVKQAGVMQQSRIRADRLTQKIYNQAGVGTDVANSFKHIYWSAYATQKIGEKYTKLFTNAHEFGWYKQNVNDPEAMKMDLHNNQRGRILGKRKTQKSLKNIILNDIAIGNAAIIVNGKSVYTEPVFRERI